MMGWDFVLSLVLFNGVLAYAYQYIRSTHRNRFPYMAAYVITGKYLVMYVMLSLLFSKG